MKYKGTIHDDNYIGTGQNDVFNMVQGGSDTVSGGDGNDVFKFGSALDSADKIDGGTGNDTLKLSGAAYSSGINVLPDGLVSVEKIMFAAGSSYEFDSVDTNVAAGATMTIDASALGANDTLAFLGFAESNGKFHMIGGAGGDTLEGGSGDDVLNGGAGDDFLIGEGGHNTVSGGTGNDQLYLDNGGGIDHANGNAGDDLIFIQGAYTVGTQINGGPGKDELVFANGTSNTAHLDGTSLIGIEKIAFDGGGDQTLFLGAGAVAHNTTLEVDAFVLNETEQFTFDASAETTGSVKVFGGAANDSITGSQQSDNLDGGNGNDLLIGEAGDDILTGGAGRDILEAGSGHNTFSYFEAIGAAQSTGINFDAIVTFQGAHDVFNFPFAVTTIDPAVETGALNRNNFDGDLAHAVGTAQLQGEGHAVLFTPDSGSYAGATFLIVDANGAAGYQAGADYVFLIESLTGQITSANFVSHSI